jgi:hypothetical protein
MVAKNDSQADEIALYRAKLDCRFPQIDAIFSECIKEAKAHLTPIGIDEYLKAAHFLGGMGRGAEPILIFLQEWPSIANILGENALASIMKTIQTIWKSPNADAITSLLQSLPAIARRLPSLALMERYLGLTVYLMESTSTSIHGIHKTYPSPSLTDFIEQSPRLLNLVSLDGLSKWTGYGIQHYNHHPDQQKAFFKLQTNDSKAVIQRERHGVLLVDHAHKLDLYLLSMWNEQDYIVPYPTGMDDAYIHAPYYDQYGIRLPDVYEEFNGVSGLDRYRASLAHIAGHRKWSTPIFADNLSPLQRMAIEFIEDARIDYLTLKQYPGLKKTILALHPIPTESECDPQKYACIRHRLAILSRAIIDPQHPYQDKVITSFAAKLRSTLLQDDLSTEKIASLALSFAARTRLQSDQLPDIYFKDTVISYRDDNRSLWKFYELSDDEEQFSHSKQAENASEIDSLPPRHYPEWDYISQSYKPDWVSLYENLHPQSNPQLIDGILKKHAGLEKRLKRLLDLLKPQVPTRVRYQEDGDELDLDVAIRSLIDLKTGNVPDPRINMSHKNNGRNIAVLLLLDLSESLNTKLPSNQTVLELSQEAVSLLASTVDTLGDPFAIAGFHSNTRHDVHYFHIKGFGERWDDSVKGRLAGIHAQYSTRMGAAMRHAGHYLSHQPADKKLMLILTDGQPADVDVHDEKILIADARQATLDLDQLGIFTYCINLDQNADNYVSDIFGKQYSVIDQIEKLPEQLPKLFMALTH